MYLSTVTDPSPLHVFGVYRGWGLTPKHWEDTAVFADNLLICECMTAVKLTHLVTRGQYKSQAVTLIWCCLIDCMH